jgi:hypothetical protein
LLKAMVVLIGITCACDKKDTSRGTAADAGKVRTQQELTAEYKALKPSERLEAARSACYIGECQGFEAAALLDAADSDAERESLREAARGGLVGQYQTKLAGKAKKPVTVQAGGTNGGTLSVKGVCNRFMMEDFAGGPEKKQAKTLGFVRVECSEAALNAAVDL